MSKSKSHRRPRGHLVLSVILAAVIYHDVAMILRLSDLRILLPLDGLTSHYNAMFRVFANWTDKGFGYVVRIQVRERDAPNAGWEWRELHVPDLFPMPRGEAHVRIQNMVQKDVGKLSRQLLLIYQRRNPDVVIRRLHLHRAIWPSSPAGYLARYDERELELLATH